MIWFKIIPGIPGTDETHEVIGRGAQSSLLANFVRVPKFSTTKRTFVFAVCFKSQLSLLKE